MRMQTLRGAVLCLGAAVAIVSAGCSSSDDTNGSASRAPGSTSSGAGGQGGGGEGGATGDNGHSGAELVTAGETAISPSYKMIFTLGQPTQNQGKTTSSSYRLQGGLVGANGGVQ